MHRFVTGLIALATVAAPLGAQAPAATSMKQLDWIVGRWTGAGTMATGPGQRHNASVVETATLHAGGHVLVLQGLGKVKVEGKSEEMVVHDAFATIWHDSTGFRMQTFRSNGEVLRPEISVADRKVVWGFQDPRAGRIRFTVTLTEDGEWHEVGDASRDNGANWMRFFEMKLRRAGGA